MSGSPRGWATIELADAVVSDAAIIYGILQPGPDVKGGIPYVRPTEIQNGKIVDHELRRTTIDIAERYHRSTLEEGDIILSIVGTIGKVAVVPAALSGGNITQSSCRIRPDSSICTRDWMKYFLLSPMAIAYYNRSRLGTAVPRLNLEDVRQFVLPLPPLAEQKRIVAKLDALCGKSARARPELTRIDTLVSRYKLAVLRSSFLGMLTSDWRAKNSELEAADELIKRIPPPPQPRGGREATDRIIQGKASLAVNTPTRSAPPKWQWVPLSRVARQETGHTPSRSHPEWWDGDIPWIGIKDAGFHHGKVIVETLQKTNEAGLANSAARLLPAGTVCLSRTASVGYVTIMGKPMATSQDFVTWTCSDALVPKFLMYALMAEGDDIREFGKGTTHTTIYFPEVRAMQICLAPLEEQHEIVRRIESAFAKIDRLAVDAKRALKLLGKLDEAILAKAFRGELIPQDDNDEPAETLLERIRAERAAVPKVKSKRIKRETIMPTAKDFLNIKLKSWPPKGVSFQELKNEFGGNYDDLKEAVFASLSEDKSELQQIFDKETFTMTIRKREP